MNIKIALSLRQSFEPLRQLMLITFDDYTFQKRGITMVYCGCLWLAMVGLLCVFHVFEQKRLVCIWGFLEHFCESFETNWWNKPGDLGALLLCNPYCQVCFDLMNRFRTARNVCRKSRKGSKSKRISNSAPHWRAWKGHEKIARKASSRKW